MVEILYVLVILTATFLGACAGLGGGVIIKPALDAIGAHDIYTISFLSTCTVFTMSAYATLRRALGGEKCDIRMLLFVSAGSMAGGVGGESLFSATAKALPAQTVTAIQSLILTLLLVLALAYVNGRYGSYRLTGRTAYACVGALLGLLSSFLGIGGGPFNVAAFTLFFSAPIKRAVLYSLVTIFFSQGAKLLSIARTTGFGAFDLSLLWLALPAALLGGALGAWANRKFSSGDIVLIFNLAVLATTCLTVYNLIRAL